MSRFKVKVFTFSAAIVTVGLTVVLGFLLKDIAIEQLYIPRLFSDDEHTRESAAGTLGAIGSVRCIPHLMMASARAQPDLFLPAYGITTWNDNTSWSTPGQSGDMHHTLPESIRAELMIYALAIERIGQKIGKASFASTLKRILLDKNLAPKVRALAARTIGETSLELASEPASVVATLIDTMRDNYPLVRSYSANALWQIGPAAKPAIPAIIYALKDREMMVRSAAASALCAINGMSSIIEYIDNKDVFIRCAALTELLRLGPDAQPAIPALINALKDNDPGIRRYIIEILGNCGSEAKDAVRILTILLRDKGIVRMEAIKTLGKIGRSAKPACEALKEMLNAEDKQVVELATDALKKIDFAN